MEKLTSIEEGPIPDNSIDFINQQIQANKILANFDANQISDGYHTFGELYEHRITLYVALLNQYYLNLDKGEINPIWKSEVHSDGTSYPGWFLLGIFSKPGFQITYHLPNKYWDDCDFAKVVDKAPEFDGHTSADVLERIKNL